MDDDGSNVVPIGHLNIGAALHPVLLRDGRVIVSTPASFTVTADFPVDGAAAGDNLAPQFKPTTLGTWELAFTKPLAKLAKGKLTISVKDRQGNVTRIERTFSVLGEKK